MLENAFKMERQTLGTSVFDGLVTKRYEFGGIVMMKSRIQYPTFAEFSPRDPKSGVGCAAVPLKDLA